MSCFKMAGLLAVTAAISATLGLSSPAYADNQPLKPQTEKSEGGDNVAARWAEIQDKAQRFEALRAGQLMSAAPVTRASTSMRFKQALEQAERK